VEKQAVEAYLGGPLMEDTMAEQPKTLAELIRAWFDVSEGTIDMIQAQGLLRALDGEFQQRDDRIAALEAEIEKLKRL
jgi:uncharacterized coiled-coil protein SlyX